MRESMPRTCQTFSDNRKLLKRCMRSADSRINAVCAIILMRTGMADETLLEECKNLLNQETGVFSNFRGFAKLPSITMLSVSGHPETRMDQAKETYRLMKQYYHGSPYLALSAITLNDLVPDWQMEEVISRGRRLYKRMRKEHPFLTSGEDASFSILLALSDRSDDALIEEMEHSYEKLRGWLPAGNGLQSLTHVLTMGDGPWEEKCEKVHAIYRGLADQRRKYGRQYELSALGCAALLPLSVEEIIENILYADTYLKDEKGYGFWGMSKRTRLMHAALLLAADCEKGRENTLSMNTAALTSTIALVAAEQAVICAMIAANAAAASSAS